jgi:hypothetical protein
VGNRGGTVNGTSVFHVELAVSTDGIVLERIGDQLENRYIKNASASTGFISIDGWGASGSLRTTTTNDTFYDKKDGTIVFNGASLTATLPDPTTVPLGRKFTALNINASPLSVVSAGTSKTINGTASQTLTQWSKATYLSDTTQWLVVGDGNTGTVSTAGETAVSTTTTLTSAALGTSVACTVTSAFTLTLPTPVGVAGQQVAVRVVPSSSQLLTLATAAGNIGGQSTRIMWAGESATLESDGANWVKISGKTIPMRCSLRMTAAQTLPNGANTTATLDTTTLDNTGLMATLGSNGITIQRPGAYTVLARTGMDQPATNCVRFVSMAQKNSATTVVQQETFAFAGAVPSFCAVDDVTFAAADIVKLQAYQTCTTPVTRNFTTGATALGTALTVREIPAW